MSPALKLRLIALSMTSGTAVRIEGPERDAFVIDLTGAPDARSPNAPTPCPDDFKVEVVSKFHRPIEPTVIPPMPYTRIDERFTVPMATRPRTKHQIREDGRKFLERNAKRKGRR